MSSADVHLMAHLMRRAGFGATRDDLESAIGDGYEKTVDALLDTSRVSYMPDDIIRRYHVDQSELRVVEVAVANWLYRMMTTTSPLQEKIALFWHSLFATGERKVNNVQTMVGQIETFRKYGLGSFRTLLVQVSRDPAMLHWLDNHDNHRDAVNENYGRELLELFSMGIGNYTEQDVKEAARAFTGWTFENAEYMALRAMKASIWPYSRVACQFEFRSDDHDYSEKTFLGESGQFDGEDVIDVIVRQPATARFVCTRLYQFFVADEVHEDGEALIARLCQTYFDSGYEIGAVLRDMFNSDHFKSVAVRFRRVKSPAELVAGTLRTARPFPRPTVEMFQVGLAINYMGQELMNPPSVEGWHEGAEWIDSGSLVERVNFASRYLGNPDSSGVRDIADRLACEQEAYMDSEMLVHSCLDLIGPITVSDETRATLVASSEAYEQDDLTTRVAETLRLIGSTREYQLA